MRSKRLLVVWLSIIGIVAASYIATAHAGTTYTWTGANGDSEWGTAANWSPSTGTPGGSGNDLGNTDVANIGAGYTVSSPSFTNNTGTYLALGKIVLGYDNGSTAEAKLQVINDDFLVIDDASDSSGSIEMAQGNVSATIEVSGSSSHMEIKKGSIFKSSTGGVYGSGTAAVVVNGGSLNLFNHEMVVDMLEFTKGELKDVTSVTLLGSSNLTQNALSIGVADYGIATTFSGSGNQIITLAKGSDSVDHVNISGTLNLGNGSRTIVVNHPDGWASISGNINGNATVTKSGDSDLTLNGSGTTADTVNWNVAAGRLFFHNGSRLGGGAVTVAGGATLDYQGSSDTVLNNAITLTAGSNVATRSAALTLSATALPTAGTMIFNYDDQATYAIYVDGNAVNLTDTLRIQVGGNNSTVGAVTINNLITGSGGVTKTQSGALVLAGDNSYTGDTTVSGGTLSITKAFLADESAVSIADGAYLNLNYDGKDTIAALYINGVKMVTGTWGASTNSGAQYTSDALTGTGLLYVVPEPSMLILTAMGMLSMIAYSWRKRK